MKLNIGQRILCKLANADELIEGVIEAIIPAAMRNGQIFPACVRLTSGRYARINWIVAAFPVS